MKDLLSIKSGAIIFTKKHYKNNTFTQLYFPYININLFLDSDITIICLILLCYL